MAELYEMNMPFFVPAAEVLLRHSMPRELFASPPPPRPGPVRPRPRRRPGPVRPQPRRRPSTTRAPSGIG